MKRLLFFVIFVLFAGCAPRETPVYLPRNERELLTDSKTLGSDATLTAVGLRPRAEKDDSATTWDSEFHELPTILGTSEVRRPFRVTLTNRAPGVRRFDVTIRYEAGDGSLLRARTFRNLLVPPFTEKTFTGFSRFAHTADVHATMEAKPLEQEL